MCNVTIIDTGLANLSSVKIAFEKIAANRKNINLKISSNLDDIKNADKLVLPGVGTAKFAMDNLTSKNLAHVIINSTKPLLGICLGMQILAKSSSETLKNESPSVNCLGLIDAKVELLKNNNPNINDFRLPHMGWNKVKIIKDHPIFKNIPNESYFYFVHSYAMNLNENTIATCNYGECFSAVVAYNNFIGTQFHPEKSGEIGSKLLANFVDM